MALIRPLPYMRTRLNALGYSEWRDAFNAENIPASIIDGAYHLQMGTVTGGPANQLRHQFDFPVVLRVFFKGYNDPTGAVDDVLLRGDTILESVLDKANRLTQAEDIKDVYCTSVQALALAGSNDNSIILQMEFVFNIYECF